MNRFESCCVEAVCNKTNFAGKISEIMKIEKLSNSTDFDRKFSLI